MFLKKNSRNYILLLLLVLLTSINTKPSYNQRKSARKLSMKRNESLERIGTKKIQDLGLSIPEFEKEENLNSLKGARKARRRSKKLDRHLYMEKRENPKSSDLFSGKQGLDKQYQTLVNDHEEMKKKMNRNQASLYKEYHKFEKKRGEMKRKRDRKLKDLLASATVDNFFHETGKIPKKTSDKILEVSDSGLIVKDEIREKEERNLMGMKDLHDLKNLDISKELKSRRNRLKEERKEDFEEGKGKHFNQPRKLLDSPVQVSKKVKNVKKTASPSFFLRNDPTKKRNPVFKGERELSSKRKLAETRKLTTVAREKKKAKIKAVTKKFKKTHKFNWKTMKWEQNPKYTFKLLTSVKDLKFWSNLGFKIKKHKLKLENRYDVGRKENDEQMQCVLTGIFSKLKIYNDANVMMFKVTFKSNCQKYPLDKYFLTRFNMRYGFQISVGPFQFKVDYYNQMQKVSLHRSRLIDLKVFPRYESKTFMPHDSKKLLWKAGLIPTSGLKWKGMRTMTFTKYQHAYPLRTYKQGLLFKAMLKRKKREKHLAMMAKLRGFRNAAIARQRRDEERRRRMAHRRRYGSRNRHRRRRLSRKPSRRRSSRRRPSRRRSSRRRPTKRRSSRRKPTRRRRSRRRRRRRKLAVSSVKAEVERKLEDVPEEKNLKSKEDLNKERELSLAKKEIIKESDFAREPENTPVKAEQAPVDKERKLKVNPRQLRRRRRRKKRRSSRRPSKRRSSRRKSSRRKSSRRKSSRRKPSRRKSSRRKPSRRKSSRRRAPKRKLYRPYRRRRRPINHRMNLVSQGYEKYYKNIEYILVSQPLKPLIPLSAINHLWNSGDKLTTCNASHLHLCNI